MSIDAKHLCWKNPRRSLGGILISNLIGSLKKLQQTLYQLKHDSKVHKKLWNKISTIERFNLNEKINYEYDKKNTQNYLETLMIHCSLGLDFQIKTLVASS